MSKILLCGECGDLVAPGLRNQQPRWCECKRHAVWWEDTSKGIIRVYDRQFRSRSNSPGGKAWFVGIANSILTFPSLIGDPHERVPDTPALDSPVQESNYRTRKPWVESLLAMMPDGYLFKTANSLVIRFYPGATSDSSYADRLPDGSTPS